MFRRFLTSAIFYLACSMGMFAQNTSVSSNTSTLSLKPRLGIGMGTFFYRGEVGRSNRSYNPGSASMAYKISLTNDITPFLEVELYSIFGHLSVNEYSLDRSKNFYSQIRTGGVAVSYNFGNLISRQHRLRPTFSVGIETIEFLTKADRMDANGNMYHYWTDGTIRDVDQRDQNATNANIISQDYIYETDLRNLNEDGLGKYADKSWSVPVGVSAQWFLTDRFRAKFGSQMHFTFTDLIDNISDAGKGPRKGDARNDKIIFTHIGLSYDLNITPKNTLEFIPLPMEDENGEMMAINVDMDGDKDGVNDLVDHCTGTPEGAEVDKYGCAIDKDKDGVPDYRDEELWTALNAPVDHEGITIIDAEFLEKYLIWTDSISMKNTLWTEDYVRVEADMNTWINSYSVSIAAETDGLTQAEINLLLSYTNVKKHDQDGTEMYLVGPFEELPRAVAQQKDLAQKGIQGTVVQEEEDGELVDKTVEAMEVVLSDDTPTTSPEGMLYRVQIGAFRYDISNKIFTGIEDIISLRGDDGLTRLMTSSYDNPQDAAKRKTELLLQGFEGAFITAYTSGTRITLADAGMSTTGMVEDLTYDVENNSIDPDKIVFRVQMGAYRYDIPTEVLDVFLNLGNVKPIQDKFGVVRYLSGKMDQFLDAQHYLKIVHNQGIEDAFIVGEFDGKIIPTADARMIKEGGNIQAIMEEDE